MDKILAQNSRDMNAVQGVPLILVHVWSLGHYGTFVHTALPLIRSGSSCTRHALEPFSSMASALRGAVAEDDGPCIRECDMLWSI